MPTVWIQLDIWLDHLNMAGHLLAMSTIPSFNHDEVGDQLIAASQFGIAGRRYLAAAYRRI